MSSRKNSPKGEIAITGVSTSPVRRRVTGSKDELRTAINRLYREVHRSKHPLDKIGLYEEIKRLENEISSLGDGD